MKRELLKTLGLREAIVIAWIAGKTRDRIVLRDSSGIVSLRPSGVKAKELFKLPLETLVAIKCKRIGDSLLVEDISIIHLPDKEREINYLQADKWSITEHAKYYPWALRHPRYSSIIRLQSIILNVIRDILLREGFIELISPMISIVSDPGLRGARKLKTLYYGEEYELTSSIIMYKQSSVAVFDKIFYVARNIREEPPENITTGRHLSEFTQIDIEWALASIDDVMRLAEKILEETSRIIAEKHMELLYSIGYRREPVVFKPPFKRIPYDEAIETARKLGYSVEWGKELSHEAETGIAQYYGEPVWIVGFPKTSRGFYYLPDPRDEKYNLDFNLILPEGYGEVIDGGTREYRYRELVRRIKMLGEPLEKYQWFLQLAENGGIPPSSGWGLGLERLTRYMAGAPHIAYAAHHPKLPGITGTP